MTRNRLEAFSDGVFAIIITIMVLELKVPHALEHAPRWSDLAPLLPIVGSYVLSFIYVAIYWNNHHHLFHSVRRVSGSILWANMHLLFWLSLFPFVTAWTGENHFAPVPCALYGAVLLLAAISYLLLMRAILAVHGKDSVLGRAVGSDFKGKFSPVLYACAIPLAFVHPWISCGLYLAVALIWLVPDARIERALAQSEQPPTAP